MAGRNARSGFAERQLELEVERDGAPHIGVGEGALGVGVEVVVPQADMGGWGGCGVQKVQKGARKVQKGLEGLEESRRVLKKSRRSRSV